MKLFIDANTTLYEMSGPSRYHEDYSVWMVEFQFEIKLDKIFK